MILCERGIRTYENFTRNTLDISAVPVIKKLSHLPVIVDPSHASGINWLIEPLAMAAAAIGADGLIIEVHNDPAHALCDGAQSLTPDQFAAVADTPLQVNLNMTDLNCQAVVAMCQITAPYMPRGSQIINIASVAAFQPIPYIDIYGATKAFVLSFSRALNRELKSRGIGVMAVCPFWTKTAFFDRAIKSDETPIVKKYAAMYDPDDIVARTWRDAKRGKDVCKYGFVARVQAGLTKLLPHSVVMDVWMKQQDLH